MGLGDEIMALGRMEALYEQTGKTVSCVCQLGLVRDHAAWHGNPSWSKASSQTITDGGGYRPYIKEWQGNKIIFNHDYRPRAGKIYLTEEEKAFKPISGDYVIIAPHLKGTASHNKDWGFSKWQEVARRLNIQIVQLIDDDKQQILEGAKLVKTKTFRLAASVIANSKLVLCNEGGSHHMAASMGIPAVVVFGSFVPPLVTGYSTHANITTEDAHYCGDWTDCQHCKKALSKITPDVVLSLAERFLRGENAQGIYRV